ncbi:hypothetical protein MBLNU230_g5395t1 [Neophaeotheca triangularis]
MLYSITQTIHSDDHKCPSKPKRPRHVVEPVREKSMEAFTSEVRSLLEAPLEVKQLLLMSGALGEEYRERLQSSEISMLPSYHHTLPTGTEEGDFLTLDVGGSTLRIALVRLTGRRPGTEGDTLQTTRIRSFPIDKAVRDLEGQKFFDWMAERIEDMLSEYNRMEGTNNAKLDMGVAWSFPIEQTSQRSGRILPMGKDFHATQGIEGQDLSSLIMRSCAHKDLNVEMKAIVNDSSATLLSQAYRDPTTRISLILGTGTNAAIYLPTSILGPSKHSSRPASWRSKPPPHTLINTEMSMFGKNTLPRTRWDRHLNATHPLPDFQPLEYLTAGRYLGEIVRLILLEAYETTPFLSNQKTQTQPHPTREPRPFPIPSLRDPYTLTAPILAAFETDPCSNLPHAATIFQTTHPTTQPLTPSDLNFIRETSLSVTNRAAALVATALHALWLLHVQSQNLEPSDKAARVVVAANGSIVEKFPLFRGRVQGWLDLLAEGSGADRGAVWVRVVRGESGVLGAGVSCAVADADAGAEREGEM